MTKIFPNEAQILSQYLIGKNCSGEVAENFSSAVEKLNIELNEAQTKTYQQMLNSQFLLRSIDSGMALVKSQSIIRKRIFVLLALLECTKENTAYFLPRERNWSYFFLIGLRVTKAFLYAFLGLILIKIYSVE